MALQLPPVPLFEPQGSMAWQQWYLSLQNLYTGTGTIAWDLVDKTGSDLADLAAKSHGDLTSFQGGTSGERYHLTSAQHTTVGTLAAGTYTPTLSNTTNVAASTAYECQYLRVGATVTVSGKVDVDPTGAGDTVLGITLPVASNFGTEQDAGGVAAAYAISQSAAIFADSTNDRVTMRWTTTDTSNRSFFFTFTYQVI